MKKTILQLSVILFLLASCGQMGSQQKAAAEAEKKISETEQAFFNNLAGLCGKSFAGKETYMARGRESWAHRKFVMHVTVCEPDKVLIPFHLDDDHSRTWMFLIEEGRLRFRHDHRHDDGTPEDLTLYGGYSDGTGSAFVQRFPADDYTNSLLDDDHQRQWNVILAEDLSTLSYQLLYNGEFIFEAQFDLTTDISNPEATESITAEN